MSNLKPCPFCGSEKLNIYTTDEESKSGFDMVECDDCGVELYGDTDNWNVRADDEEEEVMRDPNEGGWISVDDNLPPHRKNVLTVKSNGGQLVSHIINHDNGFTPNWQWTIADRIGVKITHWQPLPAPPI